MNLFINRFLLVIRLLRKALQEFLKNDPLRMAGATAFFTTFALPPIMVIIIQSLKYVVGPDVVRSKLFGNLTETLGIEATQQLRNVLQAFRKTADNWWITIGGFIFLLFVATTLFRIIKNSINQIWKIRADGKHKAAKTIHSRLMAIVVILVAGILLVIGLMAESAQVFIGKYLKQMSPLLTSYFNAVWGTLFSILITTSWFAIVFRYLADGKPKWKIAWVGALLTSLLFMLGKMILHVMLSYSNINNFYGTSASIVLLLLFVFYSALILYFGASFTKIWGEYQEEPITPAKGFMHYTLVEVKEEDEL
jgi:membrane protein